MSKNIASILPSAEGADRSPKGRARRIFDGLRRDWESVARYKGVASSPYWREDGLFLGAGTRLAERIQGNEARIIALLVAGFRKYLSIAVLSPLVASERAWRAGRAAEASAHIQRLNMPLLAGRDAAYRLHLAAGFLDSALLTPGDLLRICDVRADALAELRKYNPDQPRVPVGNPDGGQWTSEAGDDGGSAARKPPDHTALILPDGCETNGQRRGNYV
jgi:hypothetical protein